ncbi:P-type Cu(2+) transporter [Salvia divinorum]|uniref:P-type Cu(2+) transporter n=1 Tax=Salvia divinorum TaxID=28513 RepID=A0ABD1I7I0_SALDI
MESTILSLGASTISILLLSKSRNSHSSPLIAHLHRRFSSTLPLQLAHLQLRRFGPGSLARVSELRPDRSQFCARYSVLSASGGGGFGGAGGDGSPESSDFKPGAVADGAALSSDVIILDVGGMTCGGCSASVRRILESQPQVSSASVNLTTETAIVWPVSEAMAAPNWKKEVGETLAKHLSSCGFTSNLRDQEAIEGDIQL